jgi:hypothetical protein
MVIIGPITESATNPRGQEVPIHIAWFLIWVAALAALLFLIAHAIHLRYFAKIALSQGIPRHAPVARLFHWSMAAAMFTLLVPAFLPKIGVQLNWVTYHWIAGSVLTASTIFHIIQASF